MSILCLHCDIGLPTELLIIDGDTIKFGDKPEDFRYITDRIDAELFGLFPFESTAEHGSEVK